MRLSEPCNRGTLKGTHQSFVFLEEMVGTPAQERLTRSALYGVINRELLASAQPERPTKQAPRMLSPLLYFLEQLVMNETSPMYLRVYSWWMLVQNWATLRFSDHRGLNPSEVAFREGSFHARLTRQRRLDKTKRSLPSLWLSMRVVSSLIVNGSREAGLFFKAWKTSLATTSCQPPHHIARAAESWSSGMMQRLPCRT